MYLNRRLLGFRAQDSLCLVRWELFMGMSFCPSGYRWPSGTKEPPAPTSANRCRQRTPWKKRVPRVKPQPSNLQFAIISPGGHRAAGSCKAGPEAPTMSEMTDKYCTASNSPQLQPNIYDEPKTYLNRDGN